MGSKILMLGSFFIIDGVENLDAGVKIIIDGIENLDDGVENIDGAKNRHRWGRES